MAARTWILLACTGVALIGPACALVIGAHELPEGQGGASSTSGTSTGGGTTSTTTTSTTQTGTTTTTTAPAVCQGFVSCVECAQCMEQNGRCNLADAGCPDGSACSDYTACVVQCPMGTGYPGCAAGTKGCASSVPPEWPTVQACLCTECAYVCKGMCM